MGISNSTWSGGFWSLSLFESFGPNVDDPGGAKSPDLAALLVYLCWILLLEAVGVVCSADLFFFLLVEVSGSGCFRFVDFVSFELVCAFSVVFWIRLDGVVVGVG